MSSQALRMLGRQLITLVVLVAVTHVSLLLELHGGYAPLIWALPGVALALMWMWGWSLWPAVLLAAGIVESDHLDMPASYVLNVAGSVVQPVLGVWILRQLHFDARLQRVQDVLALMLGVGALTSVLCCGFDYASLWAASHTGVVALDIWLSWWMADCLGVMLVSPALLTLFAGNSATPRRHPLETFAGIASLVLVSLVIFGNWEAAIHVHLPLTFLTTPFLVWLAIRLGPRVCAVSLLALAVIVATCTKYNMGPFSDLGGAYDNVLLWAYLGTASLTTLMLAAVTTEREQSQADLFRSRQQYRAAVHHQSDLVCRFLPDTTLTFVNEAYCKFFGKRADELIGRSFLTLVPESKWETIKTHLANQARSPSIVAYEHEVTMPDGSEGWQLWVDQAIIDHHGRVVEFQSTGRDITPRIKAEAALRRSEELNRRIIEAVPGGVVHVASDGSILQANTAAKAFLGLSLDQLTQKFTHDFAIKTVHEDGRPCTAQEYPVSQCLATGKTQPTMTIGVARPDGTTRWADFTATPTFDARNHVTGAVVTFLDITDRKRMEDVLRRREIELRTLTDNVPDLLARFDRQYRHVFVNRNIEQHTGMPAEQFIGKSNRELDMPAELVATWEQRFQQVFDTGISTTIEFTYPTPEGEKHYEAVIVPEFSPDGTIQTVLGITRDFTLRKNIERELRRSEQRYRDLVEQSNDAIIRTSVDGRITFANPACQQMLGYELDKLMHDPDVSRRLIHPDYAETFDRFWNIYRQTGRFSEEVWELGWMDKHGQCVITENTFRNIHDEHGAVIGFQSIGRNITRRKLAMKQMRQQSELLETIIENIPVMIAFTDKAGKIRYVNRCCEKTLGITRDQMRDMDAFEIFYPDPIERQRVMQYVLNPPPGWADFVVTTRDGRTLETSWANILLSDGTSIGIGQDITQRKLAERALRESEEHYRNAAQTSRRLVDEVNHRVRNNLASLLSLMSLISRRVKNVDDFAEALRLRVLAMANVHNLLAQSNWGTVDLRNLVEHLANLSVATLPHHVNIEVAGPGVLIAPKQVLPLALTFSELFTNSAKYGSHSAADGSVRVTWETVTHNTQTIVRLRWQETDGPAVTQVNPPSLGTELIRGLINYELSGQCEMNYPSDGASHDFEFRIWPADESAPDPALQSHV